MTVLDPAGSAIACGPHNSTSLLHVAIVGCGPKGLFCLEQLAKQLASQRSRKSLRVSIFEPAEFPGAGIVYDPRQPRYLRMNFAAEHIDVWQHAEDGPSLLRWLRGQHPEFAAEGQFVPRSLVGEYLHACYQSVISRLSKCATVVEVKQHVTELIKSDAGWSVVTNGGRRADGFDEVLLAVGHEGWRADKSNSDAEETFDVPHVYPTTQQLSPAAAPAGSRIALRGIGLTAIDAILALTEGRGGAFESGRYMPSGDEPFAIYPYSRSGRPILAKPVSPQVSVPDLEDVWEHHAARLAKLAEAGHPLRFVEEVWPQVLAAAESALPISADANVGLWFDSWLGSRPRADEFREQVARSIEVATGKTKPGAAWALGEAWRRLYPTLVSVLSHDGLADDSWPHFRTVAAEMERIAFGAPVDNCRKLLSLIDCGLVKLAFLQGRVERHDACQQLLPCDSDDRLERIDLHVNTVLPGSASSNPSGPLDSLAKNGSLATHASGCGYRIDRSGHPITVEGTPMQRLTLVGRPTEGAVLGNDTLNPRLHDLPSRWAGRVVQQLERSEGSAS